MRMRARRSGAVYGGTLAASTALDLSESLLRRNYPPLPLMRCFGTVPH
jgi:hypothetical protein